MSEIIDKMKETDDLVLLMEQHKKETMGMETKRISMGKR